jgi:ubiquinone/menaquinone biosynthesis C-methylase UbiE
MVQKIPDGAWLEEIATIYKDYAAYSLAGGEEQLVLDPQSGQPRKRSEVLMSALHETDNLPGSTRALDVGCGHGVTLMAMAKAFPGWQLMGHELDQSKHDQLLKIHNFQRLYTGNFSQIDETFGFISMIHSLEHFVDPMQTLRSLTRLSDPEGHLFIEVCNVEENPFDLLVADHLTHFSPDALAFAVDKAGYEVTHLETMWVKKELSLLAKKSEASSRRTVAVPKSGREVHEKISASVRWLSGLVTQAEATATSRDSFGIFGTSIAGTWLATALGDRVKYFVDEDPNRVGREYMGIPVLSPHSVPQGSTVFLSLAPTLAQAIKQRLSRLDLGLDLVVPPELKP